VDIANLHQIDKNTKSYVKYIYLIGQIFCLYHAYLNAVLATFEHVKMLDILIFFQNSKKLIFFQCMWSQDSRTWKILI
jgi:hypothetical protein